MKWDNFLSSCQSGDIILFDGSWWLSRLIEWGQNSHYSHVGMILRSPTYIREDLSGIYLLQSGYDKTPDILTGKCHLGVQITPIEGIRDEMIKDGGSLWVRCLHCSKGLLFEERVKSALSIVKDDSYDLDPVDWIKGRFDIEIGDTQRTNTFFCSALIAYMYVQMDLLESSLPWSIISPRHFSAKENEQLSFINCSLEEDEQIILT